MEQRGEGEKLEVEVHHIINRRRDRVVRLSID